EKRKAEEALANSEKRFRSLIENNKDIVVLTDHERRVLYISPSVTRTLGYTPEELIGKGPQELWHPDDLEPIDKLRRGLP
ncbi:PAS domain S-box protein, partial [Shewanella algae]|uniref:PAS domain-containing protein n=1 Tax=Shewanella algae TaxID=38313 RepID=UPI00313B8B99